MSVLFESVKMGKPGTKLQLFVIMCFMPLHYMYTTLHKHSNENILITEFLYSWSYTKMTRVNTWMQKK